MEAYHAICSREVAGAFEGKYPGGAQGIVLGKSAYIKAGHWFPDTKTEPVPSPKTHFLQAEIKQTEGVGYSYEDAGTVQVDAETQAMLDAQTWVEGYATAPEGYLRA